MAFSPKGGFDTIDVFNQWVQDHKKELVGILFPAGLSAAVSGTDLVQNHAQQFLFSTALGGTPARQTGRADRSEVAGLFEVERFGNDASSGTALQGLYRIEKVHLLFTGRYAQRHDKIIFVADSTTSQAVAPPSTGSFTFSADYHPFVTLTSAVDWRLGLQARSGILLSRASTLDYGSFDLGGGLWTSVQKDFSRVRIGAGSIFQGGKEYVPAWLVGEELQTLIDVTNERAISWNFSYGALGGFLITDRMSLNGKFLQTRPAFEPAEDSLFFPDRPTTTILIGSVSYLIAGLTPIDIGYKYSTTNALTYSTTNALTAHGFFVQGYFSW